MKIKVLDGLRGYAALLVVLSHMPQITNSEYGVTLFRMTEDFSFAYIGVELFFVLSGFLITRILLRNKREGVFSFKLFYLKRALRIFPIYFLVLFVCMLLFSFEGVGYLFAYMANYYFAFNTVELHPLAHTWSLSVEEHFYLFWPLIIYFFDLETVRKYTWVIVSLVVSFSLAFAHIIFEGEILRSLLYNGTEFRMLALVIGSTLAFHESRIWELKKTTTTRWLAFLMLFFFISFRVIVQYTLGTKFPIYAIQLVILACATTCFFVLVLIQENRDNTMKLLFSNQIATYLGKVSYGLYLYHYPIFYWWGMSRSQRGTEYVTAFEFAPVLATTLLVTALSYEFLEKPLLRYKTKLVFNLKPSTPNHPRTELNEPQIK